MVGEVGIRVGRNVGGIVGRDVGNAVGAELGFRIRSHVPQDDVGEETRVPLVAL